LFLKLTLPLVYSSGFVIIIIMKLFSTKSLLIISLIFFSFSFFLFPSYALATVLYTQDDGSQSLPFRDATGFITYDYDVGQIGTGWTTSYTFQTTTSVSVWVKVTAINSATNLVPRLYGATGGAKCTTSTTFDPNDYLNTWEELTFTCNNYKGTIIADEVVIQVWGNNNLTELETLTNSDDKVYILISDDGTDDFPIWSEPVVYSNSFTTWVEPENGTSTPSRTIDYNFEYYFDTSTGLSTSTFPYLNMDFYSLAYPDNDVERTTLDVDYYDVTGFNSGSVTLDKDGYYMGMVYFTDGLGRVLGTDTVKFNSATTTLVADIPLLNPVGMCDSLDGTFDTAICKSMMFLFYPSDTALDKFASIQDIFNDKIPFGYYYQFKDLIYLQSISSSTAPVLSVNFGSATPYALSGNISLIDLGDLNEDFDFTIIFTWLVRFMWIIFGVYVISRVILVSSKI